MKAYQRAESTKHMVDIDVPIGDSITVYHVVMQTQGIIGYKNSFSTPEGGDYETLTVDLGSLPAIIEELGIGPVGEGWLDEQKDTGGTQQLQQPVYDGIPEIP
jgi:hypothetical protein